MARQVFVLEEITLKKVQNNTKTNKTQNMSKCNIKINKALQEKWVHTEREQKEDVLKAQIQKHDKFHK